jgi:hypothetical protein
MGILFAAALLARTAAGQPLPVELRLAGCTPQQLDPEGLASLLQIELPPIANRAVEVSQSLASTLADPGALHVDVQCNGSDGSLMLAIESRQLAALRRTAVPVSDVLPTERTRIMAMAVAELLRAMQDQPPTPTISAAPEAAAVAVVPVRSTGHRPRLRPPTVALLSVGLVTGTAGVVLGSLVWSNLVHGPGGDIVGGIGYGALGVSGLSLVAMGLTFKLDMR